MGMLSTIFAVITASITTSPTAPLQDKPPIPDEATQERIRLEIKDLLKDAYSKRDRDSRRNLAAELYRQSDTSQDDAHTLYVLLKESAEISAELGDASLALAALERIRRSFTFPDRKAISGFLELQTDSLARAARATRDLEQARTIAQGYLTVAQAASREGEFSLAQDVAKKAASLARKARDRRISSKASAFTKSISELKREFEAFTKHDMSSSIDLDAHDHNLRIGRFLAFTKGDMLAALPFLASTGSDDLAGASRLEREAPNEPATQFILAEKWWGLSKGERTALHKQRYLVRAQYWCDQANLAAQGVLRLRIGKRLDEIEKLMPDAPKNVLRLVDLSKDSLAGNWSWTPSGLTCEGGGEACRVQIPYVPPGEYDMQATLTRRNSHDAIVFGLSSGKQQWLARIDSHPANGYLTGLEMLDGKFQDKHTENVLGRRIENGRKYKVGISVRQESITISIDGVEVYSWNGKLERLSPSSLWPTPTKNALFVGAWGGGISFETLRLTSISGQGKRLR